MGTSAAAMTGRCNKSTRRADKALRNGIGREPHRYRIQTACRFFGYKRGFIQNHRQGSRPKARCQTLRDFRNRIRDFVNIFPPADVHDQRVVGRTSLRRINFP